MKKPTTLTAVVPAANIEEAWQEVGAGCDRSDTLFHNCLREHRRGRRAVAGGGVGGLARHLPHHLCAHIFELVLKLDLFGDSDAILRNTRGAPALV